MKKIIYYLQGTGDRLDTELRLALLSRKEAYDGSAQRLISSI